MSPLQLLENLTALWLPFDGEDADKNPVVNRYQVLEIAKEYFKKSNANLLTFVDSIVFDQGLDCPVDHTISRPCIVDALKAMDAFSTQKGQLPVSAFVHMFGKNNIKLSYFYLRVGNPKWRSSFFRNFQNLKPNCDVIIT